MKGVFNMYDTTERTRRVLLLVKELDHKRDNKVVFGLSALCFVLTFSLVGAIGSMMGGAHGNAQGNYGAMLLYEDAGGYVLAAVLSFAIATVITVLCIRSREKSKEKYLKEEDKEE